jgi:hypothetical protein
MAQLNGAGGIIRKISEHQFVCREKLAGNPVAVRVDNLHYPHGLV